MTNIILCGGNGTRLWPISRALMPKQFVKIFDNQSLFQLTVKRNSNICDKFFIVSNIEQFFISEDQISQLNIKDTNYLLEPEGKNTAPAIALACFSLPKDEIVFVTPSDHLIKDKQNYEKVIKKAKELALENNLVTFGISPTFPQTGFGYIEADGYDVLSFKEKPDLQTAKHYLKEGNYYWNSGMFMFQAQHYLKELKKYSPDIYNQAKKAYIDSQKDKNIIVIQKEDMQNIPEDSIDYAVMEKSDQVKVVPSDINWTDLGSFDALYDELEKDKNNNTKNPKHISIDSKNNLIYSENKVVATVDIHDLIIIDTPDALLVSKKGSSQKVKQVVNEVSKTTDLHNIHLTAHRPWGTYTVLEDTPGFKIKRLEVKPHKRLSLQRHKKRNEHWVVVQGEATVTKGEEIFILKQNQSTYIEAGEKHRLYNHTDKPLIIIETQVGDYTGEDDIERLEDDFKRF